MSRSLKIKHAPPRGAKAKRGFTLLEALAAVLILAGLSALVTQISYGNFQRIKKARRVKKAAALLERKMSDLEAEYKGPNIGSLPDGAEGEFEGEENYVWSYKTRALELPESLVMLEVQNMPQTDINIQLAEMMRNIVSATVVELKLTVSHKRGKKGAGYSLVSYFVNYAAAAGHIQSAVAQFSLAASRGFEALGGAAAAEKQGGGP